MTTMSFYEARTHFSELLDQVARGKKVLITRRGKPAALLVPPPEAQPVNVADVIRRMRDLRKGNVLGDDLSIRDLIEEGRAG
jgi:prevent-host-death family protein